MKHLTAGIVLALLPSLHCLAQAPAPAGPVTGEIVNVTHYPLPVIINGRRPEPEVSASPANPVAEETLVENLITFNPDSLDLIWSQGTWQLRCDGQLIRDFGTSETAARQMLLVLRQLRVNQYGSVGQDRPVLEYWLTDGQAPQGFTTGLRMSSLDPQTLRVEKSYGQWCIRDAYRPLFSFGKSEQEAQQSLAILRKYHFTQLGVVSSSSPPIVLLLTRPGDHLETARPNASQQPIHNDLLLAFPALQTMDKSKGRTVR